MNKRRLSYVIVAVLWAAVMAVFYVRNYGPLRAPQYAGFDEARPVPESLFKERWMGVYKSGEKIGYASKRLERTGDGLRAVENVTVTLRVMGYDKRVSITTETEGYPDFRLKAFLFAMDSDVPIKVRGTVQGRELKIVLNTAGAESSQSIPLTEAPMMGQYLLYRVLSEGIEVGKKYSPISVVEPSALTAGYLDVEVLSKERIFSLGIKREAFRLRGSFKGAEVLMWVTGEGEVLREESMGFTFVSESKEDALKAGGGEPSADLTAGVAVPVKVMLPGRVQYLKVRLGGVDLNGLELQGGVQSLSGDVIEIRRAALDSLAGGTIDEGRYLQKSLLIQSGDPAIRSLAREVAGGASDRTEVSELLYRWVYENIEKVPAITLPSATEVLKSRRGDCNEHTALYTALSRAAGVPTRVAVGLVYKEGFFYYHAWPEVFLGGWVPVDPTLGEFPAGAAHIRLLTGGLKEQIKLASVIGKITIEVLEHR